MAPPENEEKRLEIAEQHMNRCWNVRFGPKTSCCRIQMNPVVSLFAALILWSIIICIAIAPDHVNHGFMKGKDWIAQGWSWFYIISQDIWIVVLIYIAVHPKFGKLKLGRDDEEPVFSDITWFSLLFTCGVAVGLFYYVAEPMWHYKGWGNPRFINKNNGYSHPSEDAVHGMMVTWYHWGLHGWIPYVIVGSLLGLLSYRRGFPLSMRFGFYPLIGDKVYGFLGDLIDILSIVTTVMGVCTSLGLGTMSINMGLARLSQGFYRGTSESVPDKPENEYPTCGGTGHKYWLYVKTCDDKYSGDEFLYTRVSSGVQVNITSQALIIVVITLIATVSVVSGLKYGIKELSRLGFALSAFLLLFVLLTGDTVFQLNLFIQSLGYYIWYLPKIAFHTDAFELLGDAKMGNGGFGGWEPTKGHPGYKAGADDWMDIWTIFYWGWWISWAPFVGTFLAKISRGRTLRQFVLATLIVPSLYCFIWFGCVGGQTVKMQALADTSGLCKKVWLNGGVETEPPASGKMRCNLSPEEVDEITGQCKNKQGLIDAGLITDNDEAHCGRGKCSGETLKKGYCGKMLPTCDHYAASFSEKQKKIIGIGYTPSCKLDNNGEKAPVLSGVCKQFEWKHWEQKMGKCVEVTTWVDVPCGTHSDPTALSQASLACDSGTPPGKASCQDACKAIITKEMVDIDNNKRMYNHFTKGGVPSQAMKDQGVYDDMDNEFSADQDIKKSDVWVADSKGSLRLEPPQCFVGAPDNQVCVWNQKTEDVLFDLIGSLTNSSSLQNLVSIIALASLVIYFITSSDSGSLVVDILAANGEEEPPIPQRVFWAFTEGATAIALLYSGRNVDGPYGDPGEGGLRALQACSIIMGLPYTFILFWYSQALVQVCREEAGELDPERPRFKMFLLGCPRSDNVPAGSGFLKLLKNLLIPGFSPAVKAATRTWPLGSATGGVMWQIVLQVLWTLSFCIGVSGLATAFALFTFAGSIYFIFAGWISLVRREIRKMWNIPRGDFFTDFICAAVAFPFVLTQLEIEMLEEQVKKNDPAPLDPAPLVALAPEEQGNKVEPARDEVCDI